MTHPATYNLAAAQLAEAIGAAPPAAQPKAWTTETFPAARIAAGLTVREASSSASIPIHSLLVRYENGAARPPLERLEALAHAYDTTLAALLSERDEAVALIAEIERFNPATLRQLPLALARADEQVGH